MEDILITNEKLTHDQIIAIEQFVKDLRVCYENHKSVGSVIPLVGGIVNMTMDYVLQILDIHLQLAKLKFERENDNIAEALDKGVK